MGLVGLLFTALSVVFTGPLPLLRLRGGEDILLRVRTSTKGQLRVSLPETSTLAELQKLLQKEHKFPLARQKLCKAPNGGEPLDSESDAATSLKDLGIEHGAMLHLELADDKKPAASAEAAEGDAAEAPKASSGIKRAKVSETEAASGGFGSRGRKQKATTMAAHMDAVAKNEVVLETPGASKCDFVAVEPTSTKEFVDFIKDSNFTERRVAFLYGRWVEGNTLNGEKRGVYVDVVYEPPQYSESEDRINLLDDSESAMAERKRAGKIAADLGLTLVGMAFSIPPRWHTIEPLELYEIIQQQHQAVLEYEKEGSGGDEGGAVSLKDLFVGMLFRAVYEHEKDLGDALVTAEVYQPTEQAAHLVNNKTLVPEGDKKLVPSSDDVKFKINFEYQPTVDMSYFLMRVHDLGKPHKALTYGPLATNFPIANRGAELRKFHLKGFLNKQREDGVTPTQFFLDFQMLLHASGILPEELMTRLCKGLLVKSTAKKAVREAAAKAIAEADAALSKYAGLAK